MTLSTAESGVEIDGTTATIASLEAGATVKITATYTVQEADAGKTLNNTAVVTGSEGTGDEDTPEEPRYSQEVFRGRGPLLLWIYP